MRKVLVLLGVFAFMFTLVGCEEETKEVEIIEEPEEVVELTELVMSGVEDAVVFKNSSYNVLDGITVVGNDEIDYTEFVKVYISGCGVDEDNNLYTTDKATCYIEYIAVIDGIFIKNSREVEIR